MDTTCQNEMKMMMMDNDNNVSQYATILSDVICKPLKIIYVTIPTNIDIKIEKGTTINSYYLQNRESKLQYQKEYNNKNKDTYLEYQKSYYDTKRESILNKKKEKVICECGRSISVGQLTSHKKTNLHIKNLNKHQNQNQQQTSVVKEEEEDENDEKIIK
jgi:hypothetical protein